MPKSEIRKKSEIRNPKGGYMIASKNSFEPQSSEPLPNSIKVYVSGKLNPAVRVPFREIRLSPTKSFNGQTEANAPARVYDCSGPWGGAAFDGAVEQGLPPLRRPSVLGAGGVAGVAAIPWPSRCRRASLPISCARGSRVGGRLFRPISIIRRASR